MIKILVAEDDKFLSNAYRVKLEREGYEVRVVFDGEELIQVIQEFTPDLIILDLIMPKKDGFGVLQELGKSEKYKNIPVIVASNLGQSEDIVRAAKLGAQDYIVKTDLTMKKLVEKIKSLLPSQL